MWIAGVDEAGRGPWAGPVVAAAVILNESSISGLRDSKKLTPKKREQLYEVLRIQISHRQIIAGVGLSDVTEIDQCNILQATFRAMQRAILQCHPVPHAIWVDGPYLPFSAFSQEDWQRLPPTFAQQSQAIIKGDAQHPCIAAASILAKVQRDRMMLEYDQHYPQYGFARHKGYGTAEHRSALLQWGPCRIHRRSFAPVKALLGSYKN